MASPAPYPSPTPYPSSLVPHPYVELHCHSNFSFLDGTSDPEVLRIAAESGRVLVSRDVSTMPEQFEQFIQQQESPGLLLVHSQRPIGSVIEGLLLVWATWTDEDLRNNARWLR